MSDTMLCAILEQSPDGRHMKLLCPGDKVVEVDLDRRPGDGIGEFVLISKDAISKDPRMPGATITEADGAYCYRHADQE